MTKIIEVVVECPVCEGEMVVQLTEESQAKKLFEPCSVCKVLVVKV